VAVSAASTPARSWWPHARAALIAFHLVAMGANALPAVNSAALSKSARSTPTARAEIRAWTQRLQGLGVSTQEAQVEADALRVLRAWLSLRATVTAPFRPYAHAFGLKQPWLLFVGADRFPSRLDIDVERDGRWEPLQSLYPLSGPWRARFWDQTRIRGSVYAYTWKAYRGRYRDLSRWVARRVAEDDPTATRVRLQLVRIPTPTAAERQRGEVPPAGSPRRAVTHALASFRTPPPEETTP
jgi:hypothetical protein